MTPKIQLSDELRRELQHGDGKGVAVEDDATRQQYVLLTESTYQTVASLIVTLDDANTREFLPFAHQAFADEWDASGMELYDEYDRHKPAP